MQTGFLRLRAAATVEPGVLKTRVHAVKNRVEVHLVCSPGEKADLEAIRRKLAPLASPSPVDVFAMSYDLYRYQEHGEPDFGSVRIEGETYADYFGDGTHPKLCPACSKVKPYAAFGWRTCEYRGSLAKRPNTKCGDCRDMP